VGHHPETVSEQPVVTTARHPSESENGPVVDTTKPTLADHNRAATNAANPWINLAHEPLDPTVVPDRRRSLAPETPLGDLVNLGCNGSMSLSTCSGFQVGDITFSLFSPCM
jgi:hypothetical protein